VLGIGGSNLEVDGLLSVMVAHDEDVGRIVRLWLDAGYRDAKTYGEPEGQHLDYTADDRGGLFAAIRRARTHHERGVFSDITVGVTPLTFWLEDNGDVVRDDEGYPVENGDSGGSAKEALPVQIYFREPTSGNDGGDPVSS
jgi:hypothetical protein